MLVMTAERSLMITKEACAKKKKEEIERIENKFKDLLNFIAKNIHEAALKGKSSIKMADGSFPNDEDWEDIKWYLKINNYDVWNFHDSITGGYVISWDEKNE